MLRQIIHCDIAICFCNKINIFTKNGSIVIKTDLKEDKYNTNVGRYKPKTYKFNLSKNATKLLDNLWFLKYVYFKLKKKLFLILQISRFFINNFLWLYLIYLFYFRFLYDTALHFKSCNIFAPWPICVLNKRYQG